mmetsp:Transcript_29648/g.66537  ORF Transcript_29648/g.66537 Transcript_29648/m.66537 type:complete len:263 (-) Transcript_29648:143-931(-)
MRMTGRTRTATLLLVLLVLVGACTRECAAFAPAGLRPEELQVRPQKNRQASGHPHPMLQRSRQPTTSLEFAGLEGAWESYLDALEADPLLVKSVTAGVILGAADLAGQAIQSTNDEDAGGVDIARFARFAFFGFILQAPWNHAYYLLLDGALPPTEDPFTATTGVKVLIDQFVQAPIFTVIIFAFLGFLEGKTSEEIKQQLDDDYKDTMIANWKLWVPATAVNIAFCPPILRVLFLNCVFFFWSIFLSLKLNKAEDITGSEE